MNQPPLLTFNYNRDILSDHLNLYFSERSPDGILVR